MGGSGAGLRLRKGIVTSVTAATSATHRYRCAVLVTAAPTVGLVQPSSLIFVVIVAVWVAYLIQHWVRRREHLATARSVDKFSEAMRVLERRTPLPMPVASTTATALSYAGSPAVARAEGGSRRATVSSPLRARGQSNEPLPPPHAMPAVELVPHLTFAQVLVRRVRGILALASLVAVPVTVLLSALHVLKWLSVWIALGALAAVVVWLRVAAVRARAARRARRAQMRNLNRSGSASPRVGRSGATAAAHRGSGARHTEPPSDEDIPGSWKPVPVPPPTYTLKETVHRPERATEPVEERPVPVEVEDEIEAVGPRRRAVGG